MNKHEFQRLGNPSSQGRLPGFWQRVLTTLAGVVALLLAMTFSLLLFAVLLAVVAIGLVVFWWKTRALRQQMRQFAQTAAQATQAAQGQRTDASSGRTASGRAQPEATGIVIDGVATVVTDESREDRRT